MAAATAAATACRDSGVLPSAHSTMRGVWGAGCDGAADATPLPALAFHMAAAPGLLLPAHRVCTDKCGQTRLRV